MTYRPHLQPRVEDARAEYERRVAAIAPHVDQRNRERAIAIAYSRMLDRLAREARRLDRDGVLS